MYVKSFVVFYVSKFQSSFYWNVISKRVLCYKFREIRTHCLSVLVILVSVAYVENFHGGCSFSGVWCHLLLVCVVWHVIIRCQIHFFQTKVLETFALISHSRQNKDNCFGKKVFKALDVCTSPRWFQEREAPVVSTFSSVSWHLFMGTVNPVCQYIPALPEQATWQKGVHLRTPWVKALSISGRISW